MRVYCLMHTRPVPVCCSWIDGTVCPYSNDFCDSALFRNIDMSQVIPKESLFFKMEPEFFLIPRMKMYYLFISRCNGDQWDAFEQSHFYKKLLTSMYSINLLTNPNSSYLFQI